MLTAMGMLSVAAWAQDPEVVDRGVELGDFDGSGRLDHALTYVMSDGSVTIEVVLDVPERDLLLPVSLGGSDVGVEVTDVDGDRLDDLVLTVDRYAYSLTSSDRSWMPAGATGGWGDLEPDYVLYHDGKFPPGPDGIVVGTGPFNPICELECTGWVVVIYDCGPFPCFTFFCSNWRNTCGSP